MENKIVMFDSEIILDHYIVNFDSVKKVLVLAKNSLPVQDKKATGLEDSAVDSSFYEHLRKYKNDIGEKGEEFVLQEERKKLINTEYFNRIQQISKIDDRAGYDILSFDEDGTELYIEVKATENNDQFFYISQNELSKSQEFNKLGKKYVIYRVFNVLSKPNYYIINNLTENFILEPIVWKALKINL